MYSPLSCAFGLVAFVLVVYSKVFKLQKGFLKKNYVGLLESASLWVVILARVRLPTLGSPQTPRERDYTRWWCCCCCCKENCISPNSNLDLRVNNQAIIRGPLHHPLLVVTKNKLTYMKSTCGPHLVHTCTMLYTTVCAVNISLFATKMMFSFLIRKNYRHVSLKIALD